MLHYNLIVYNIYQQYARAFSSVLRKRLWFDVNKNFVLIETSYVFQG